MTCIKDALLLSRRVSLSVSLCATGGGGGGVGGGAGSGHRASVCAAAGAYKVV